MGKKKVEKLHRLVNKLASRYGDDDPDVVRLKADLDSLGERQIDPVDHRTSYKAKSDFQSETRRLYHATAAGDLHHHH